MINDLVISQIRQRLEILYQMVDELETSGGGGGGGTTDYNELTNKPRINNVTLSGNRSLNDIGVSQAISDALTPVQTAISEKVDKVAGKGLSTNDFTNTDKANLSTALSKANAAAPQSTTYTKAQVNTALAAKLNIADVDDALSSTSTDPVQNKVIQAPIAQLIDAGAKNKLNHTAYTRIVNGVNYTVNADKSITITSDGTNTQSLLYLVQNEPLAAGQYILSGCTGGSATKYDLRVKVGNTVTNNYNGGTAFTANGNPIEASIVVRAGQTLNVTIKPMISTADDYAISSKYVPYVPTTRELYEMILALQNTQEG